MENDKQKCEDQIEVTIHELKACLVFREEDEELGFVPAPAPPLQVKKEFSFTTTREEIGSEDILVALAQIAEESILLVLMENNKEIFDLFIPKIVYLDCTIDGKRNVFDEWPKMRPTEENDEEI